MSCPLKPEGGQERSERERLEVEVVALREQLSGQAAVLSIADKRDMTKTAQFKGNKTGQLQGGIGAVDGARKLVEDLAAAMTPGSVWTASAMCPL